MNSRGLALVICVILSSTACSGLFYYPDRSLHALPKDQGLTAKEHSFQSKDGTKLVGWWFPAEKPLGTVVQFHGNGENMSSHFLGLAWLVPEHFNLFVFDYRGYGKSEGEPSQKGTVEDGTAALELAWQLHKETKAERFIVVGQSLGGAILLRSIQEFSQVDKVDRVVLDSTFYSYHEVARRTLASSWVTWLFQPLAYVLVSNKYSGEAYLKNHKAPILVMHDKRDPGVAFKCGQSVFDEASETKTFWTFDDGRHIGSLTSDRPENRKQFINYIAK